MLLLSDAKASPTIFSISKSGVKIEKKVNAKNVLHFRNNYF